MGKTQFFLLRHEVLAEPKRNSSFLRHRALQPASRNRFQTTAFIVVSYTSTTTCQSKKNALVTFVARQRSTRTGSVVPFLVILGVELRIYHKHVLVPLNGLRWVVDTTASEDQRRRFSFQCIALTWRTPLVTALSFSKLAEGVQFNPHLGWNHKKGYPIANGSRSSLQAIICSTEGQFCATITLHVSADNNKN
jgi:hypothetical protein